MILLADICPREKFLCSNEKCLNASRLCDGNNDCGDNSDEGTVCTGDYVDCTLYNYLRKSLLS